MENKNPFLAGNFIVPYIEIIKRDVTDYKIMSQGLEPGDWFEAEADKYTRVYRNHEMKSLPFKLKGRAAQFMLWLIVYVPEGATSIKLEEAKLMEAFKCSDKTIKRMKAELISAAIIAKREANRYWINPRYFASDNRLELYPEHKVKVHTIRQGKPMFQDIEH